MTTSTLIQQGLSEPRTLWPLNSEDLGGVTSLNLKKLRWQLPVLAVTRAENQTGQVPWREPGMNTFSENGNDFVGRLLHEGGVSRRTFSAFPQTQTASTVISLPKTVATQTHRRALPLD